jgi:hypothetical protein
MNEPPALDPESHEDDTVVSVWRRRLVLLLLIALVIAVAAPTFGGCSGFFNQKKVVATFAVGGVTHEIHDQDLHEFMVRYNAMMRLFSDPRQPRGFPEGDEGVKSAIHVLMIDAAAKAEGVHVPDSAVVNVIQKRFSTGPGAFDEAAYRSRLSEYTGGALNHERLSDMLKISMRRDQYEQMFGAAFEVVPGQDAYETWKKRSVKLTTDYVASPFEMQRAKVDAMQPSDEDLAKLAGRQEVKRVLAIPPSKVVEVAYLKAADMTEEQFKAAKLFTEKAEIFSEERTLDDSAFIHFHENRDTVYNAPNWARFVEPDFPRRLAEFEKAMSDWEKLPKEEKEKKPQPGPAPKDPVKEYPGDAKSQFSKWKDRIEKEVLAREIVKHLAQTAERAGKSLAEVVPEYAAYGVRTAKNAEPLPDDLLVEKFPDPVARDSEFDQIARVRFKPPAEGQQFKRQYWSDPVPTTRLGDRLADRGYMVLSLESCDPARSYAIADKREEVVKIWKKLQVAEEAKKPLEEIKKEAEAAGTDAAKRREALKAAAEKRGLSVATLSRFNAKTETPKPPEAEPGQTLPADVAAVARRMALRNYVQQGYQMLQKKEPGEFVDPHWINEEKMDAAMLIMVVEKREPSAAEMQDDDLNMERMRGAQAAMQKANALFGFDAVAKRFNLQRFEEKPKKESAEAKPETPPAVPPSK